MFTTTLKYSRIALLALATSFSACGGGEPEEQPTPTVEEPAPVAKTQALDNATVRVQQNPSDPQAFIDRAIIHYKLQNLNAAIADLDTAIGLDGSLAKAYLLQGDVYFAKRDIVRAIKTMEAGAVAVPESREIALVLSRFYFYNGEHDKSIKAADNALRIDPGYAQAYFHKAYIFLEVRDTAKAISNLAHVIGIHKEHFSGIVRQIA